MLFRSRYFPDPDLLPLELSDKFINDLKKNIPELPDEKKKRFIEKFKLSPYEANILVSDIETSKYFEEVIEKSDVKLSTNWITGELFALLNEKNLEISQNPISAKNLSKLINLIKDGDRKSTRLNSSHVVISYAVFCLKKKKNTNKQFFGKKN